MSKSNPNPQANPRGRFFSSSLRQRMAEDLQSTGKAKRTQNGYLRAVRQLSDFAQCSPDKVGAKDRYIPLPLTTLKLLRAYWSTHRHPKLLFPADGRNHTLAKDGISQAQNPMSETAVQGAMKLITDNMKFGKLFGKLPGECDKGQDGADGSQGKPQSGGPESEGPESGGPESGGPESGGPESGGLALK